MRLVDGAEAIRGDLPSTSTTVIAVPLEAGEAQGSGVSRFSSIQLVRDRLAMTLATIDGPAITIGGDCGVELAAVSHVTDHGEPALVWFDAHPDLNTPESSPSTAFAGMIVRTLIGEGAPGLVPAHPVAPERIILAGARTFDAPEDVYLKESGIRVFEGDGFNPADIVGAVETTGATSVYIHIDLDVLDPSEFEGLVDPQPFGITVAKLVETIKALKAKFEFAGAGLMQFSPSSSEQITEDLPAILRIIGALAS
jgi:arginase